MTKHYSDEFKSEAVRQITEQGYSRKEVAERLGIHKATLRNWIIQQNPTKEQAQLSSQEKTIRDLKEKLRRVEQERDILKKATAYFAKLQ